MTDTWSEYGCCDCGHECGDHSPWSAACYLCACPGYDPPADERWKDDGKTVGDR